MCSGITLFPWCSVCSFLWVLPGLKGACSLPLW
uniref:Uncharacterized protein n=1 Tax=Anguilla anguilla TaxID=7936 RepID=A0A0E9SL18_ANGAN